MLTKLRLYFASALAIFAFSGCNDNDGYETSIDYTSTQVQSFNLMSNDKILNNLDSVYFSIDLVNARIFNADSLPFGTPVNKLQIEVKTDNCSEIEVRFPHPDHLGDSVINYMTNSTDSIDFSRGNVRLHVVSYDRAASRDYTLEVNVHKTVADTLLWFTDTPMSLPSSLTSISASATVMRNKNLYTLTTDNDGNYCLNTASSPLDAGSNENLSFSFIPQIESFTATESAFFILADNGDLYTSADARNWTSCDVNWTSITATYGDILLGVVKDGDTYKHSTYPGSPTTVIPEDFPVSGNSQAIRFTSKWSPEAQIITMGGTKADGTPSPTVWAYDGSLWAKIADNTPMKVTGASMFPYYVCETDTNTWTATTRSVFMTLGGTQADGTPNGTIHISYDLGFNWQEAPSLMQPPKNFPPIHGARAFIINKAMPSRAIRPITDWDTPYIYLYGGYDSEGKPYPYILQGVINKLQFKPLQ